MNNILGVLMLAVLAGSGAADTYYLDNSAAGANNGSMGTDAWQTLNDAQQFLYNLADKGAGDTVLVAAGSGSYGAYAEGAFSSRHTGIQRTSVSREGWLVYLAADPQNRALFSDIYVGGSVDSRIEFNGIEIDGGSDSSGIINGVEVRKASHVHFKNMLIRGPWTDNIFGYPEETAAPDHAALDYVRLAGISLSSNNGDAFMNDIVIEDCEIMQVTRGIGLDSNLGDSIVVRGNFIHKITNSHIHVGGQNYRQNGEILIEGNHIYDQQAKRTRYDMAHGSGIALRTDNVVIRNNILHGLGSSFGIGAYAGVSQLTIENNLLYDIISQPLYLGGRLDEVHGKPGDKIVVRNNTIVGETAETPVENESRYSDIFAFGPADTLGNTCSCFEFYNNILVGRVWIRRSTDNRYECSDYIESNNVVHGVMNEGTALYSQIATNAFLDGSNSKIVINGTNGITAFETDYFTGPFRADRLYDETIRYSAGEPHRAEIAAAWMLSAASPAMNFGDASLQPVTSLGAIGPDGFIIPNGTARNAEHHSAGAYEYGTTSLLQPQPEVIKSAGVQLPNPATPWQVYHAMATYGYRLLNPAGVQVGWHDITEGVYLLQSTDGKHMQKVMVAR